LITGSGQAGKGSANDEQTYVMNSYYFLAQRDSGNAQDVASKPQRIRL
jgi:hypothetical protein